MPTAVPARPSANRLFLAGRGCSCWSWVVWAAGLSLRLGGGGGEHSLKVQRELDGWTTVMVELQSTTRAYVASGNPELLTGHEGLLLTERAQVGKLRALVTDNPPHRRP